MLIHNNDKHHVRDIHTPRINRVAMPEYTWDDGYNSNKLPFCIVQGYCPQANCIEHQNNRAPHGNCGANPRFGNWYGDHKDCPPAGTPQGRYNRPNQHCCRSNLVSNAWPASDLDMRPPTATCLPLRCSLTPTLRRSSVTMIGWTSNINDLATGKRNSGCRPIPPAR
jgi:hypothetical protein